MKLKIKCTQMFGKELQAGDLFSTMGEEYWLKLRSRLSIGEKLYLRTETACPKDQEEAVVYKIDFKVEGFN